MNRSENLLMSVKSKAGGPIEWRYAPAPVCLGREGTVKSHLTDIFIKLGLQSRYQLIVFGRELRSPAE